MIFGNHKQRQAKQQQLKDLRRRESDRIEIEDTIGDIMDQMGL